MCAAGFVIRNPSCLGSVTFNIPGSHLSCFQHDVCHGQLLGTGRALNGRLSFIACSLPRLRKSVLGSLYDRGSVLIYLCEGGCFGPWPNGGRYPQVLQRFLNKAFLSWHAWRRHHNLQVTQSRFTCARLGRRMRSQYPGLNSKAVAGKRLSFWLADVAIEFAARAEASELDRLVATTAWSYMDWLDKLDSYPMVLTGAQANELFKMGHLHLTTYGRLRGLSAQCKGAHSNNRCLWQLLPKHHYITCSTNSLP